jgi:ABC-type sugar transport system substrate-binding protein
MTATATKLPPNPIRHFYRGGPAIAQLRGIDVGGDHSPEEWIGSATTLFGETERGLSSLPDGTLVRDALAADPDVCAVYSIGGGNLATVEAFETAGRPCAVFIAHDLDADNTRLLRDGRISAVLHHDLRSDVRHACQLVMQAQGALPGRLRPPPSTIQVITPHNLPTTAW